MEAEHIIDALKQVIDDRGVPRNIRTSCEECIKVLEDKKQDSKMKVSTCVGLLDEVSNDPNIPMHTRTFIWNIVSMLEAHG